MEGRSHEYCKMSNGENMIADNMTPEGSCGVDGALSPTQMQTNNTPDPQAQESRKGFTIYSWNINGIRSLDMKDVLKQLNADIVAVQETKISRSMLDTDTALISDYTSYFSFCRNKSGYSGVATYCGKDATPIEANEGLINDEVDLSHLSVVPEVSEDGKNLYNVDAEGRCVITEHLVAKPDGQRIPLAVINLYCPRLRCDPEDPIDNTDKKLLFHELVMKRAEMFVKAGSFVLIVGDFNISHKPLDHVEGAEGLRSRTFCRKMDEILATTFHDTFRKLNPDRPNAFTCWNSKTNARQNNYGTRLDYIVADGNLMKYLESAEIHPDIMGSDHCPVSAKFHSLVPVPSQKIPTCATKFYPELTGKQKKIHDFFLKAPKSISIDSGSVASKKAVKVKQLNMSQYIQKKPKLDSTLLSFTEIDVNISAVQENKSDLHTARPSQLDAKPVTPSSASAPNLNSSNQSTTNTTPPGGKSENASATFWKQLMKPPEVPRCTGHDELCSKKTVKKKGPTNGRQFWLCPRGAGSRTDPNANCGYFKWCS